LAGWKTKGADARTGVWWFSPERLFPPPFAANYDEKYPPGDRTQEPYQKHPVQYWPRPDHRRGVLELLNVMKGRLADAIASGNTQAIINLTSRIAAAQAAQPSGEKESALPYAKAVAEPSKRKVGG